MSNFTKLLSLTLVLLLVISLGVTSASAASITINRDSSYADGASGNRAYTYYWIFRADKSAGTYNSTGGGVNENGSPIAVTGAGDATFTYFLLKTEDLDRINRLGTWESSTSTWTRVSGNEWFDLKPESSERYVVTWVGDVTAERVQGAANWLSNSANYTAIDSASLDYNEDNNEWIATDLEEGYYLISGSEGKNLVAATTNIVINEKNSYPTIDKKQKDKDKTNFQDESVNVAVGDIIEYQVTVHIPGDANQSIAVYDTMSSGLKYEENTIDIKVDNEELQDGECSNIQTGDSDYILGCNWQVRLSEQTVIKYRNKDIVITFEATVTKDALTDTGRKNEVTLKYNNSHYILTDTVNYTTYYAGILKVDGSNETKKLEGVKFELKTSDGTAVKVKSESDYYIPDSTATSNEVVTNDSGIIIIRGLDKDKTYTVTETETNIGYNLLTSPENLTLAEDTGNTYTTTTTNTIANYTGTVLPTTGGIGTTIFYVCGGVLVIAAAAYFLIKRKMDAE